MGKNHVGYSPRAFAQDANNAMKGDIVRGIIELVTNCDDAYGDDPHGKIRIEVEHRKGRPWRVVVRDRAKGMRSERMVQAIGTLGLRTSGFESGGSVRGNLGRGAKDLAAFGPVEFESIVDGSVSRLLLEQDGSFDDPVERRADEEDRTRLGIPRGNGTTVTVTVQPNIRCPLHRNLAKALASHYQLRDINSDPRREITLVDLTTGATENVRYGRPSLAEVCTSELAVPGYPDATVQLTVFRHAERYENPPTEPGRPEGFLLKGRRAIYENTLFGLEGSPHSHWFCGTVRCEYIDWLAQDYDRRFTERVPQTEANPTPIITRSRDGLERDHPFVRALYREIESVLKPLVAEEEAKAQQGAARESAQMRRHLDILGRDLGRLIDSDLRDIDEDGLSGGDGVGRPDALVRIVPANPVLYMGETKTVSVIVWKMLGETTAFAEPDPEGVVELVLGSEVELVPHPRREDMLIGRVVLRPLIQDEATVLTVRCGDAEAAALLEVRPEREEAEPIPPEGLQFERPRYQMSVSKRRRVQLLAPVEMVDRFGSVVAVASSSADIVPLGGPRTFEFDEDLICYVASVDVDPRRLGAKGTLTASLGTETASCDVTVALEDGGPGLHIKIVDEPGGKYRALVERQDDKTVIKVLGTHAAIRRYLGPAPAFPLQDTTPARAVIAEVVAGEAARMVLEKKYSSPGELDGPAFYSDHLTYLSKYLSRCHRVLVPDAGEPG